MVNQKIFKAIIAVALFFTGLSFAENFLATDSKKQSLGSMRQEIAQLLADLMQQESKAIELKAQIQQAGFVCLQQILESDKESGLIKAKKQQLQQYLDKLKLIKNARSLEIAQLGKDLAFITSCSKK